jgi:hypothetical protein
MKLFTFLFTLFLVVSLSSCATHAGLTSNANVNNTTVELSKANYKIVQYVSGSSSAHYLFGLGGMQKSALIESARIKMLSHSDMMDKPRAIINETVEIQRSSVLFFSEYKITVSAFIIEFEKE